MRCLACKYDLSNLTPTEEGVHRCPECGRAFDPKDDLTFDHQGRISGVSLVLNAVLFLVFVILVFIVPLALAIFYLRGV